MIVQIAFVLLCVTFAEQTVAVAIVQVPFQMAIVGKGGAMMTHIPCISEKMMGTPVEILNICIGIVGRQDVSYDDIVLPTVGSVPVGSPGRNKFGRRCARHGVHPRSNCRICSGTMCLMVFFRVDVWQI